MIDDHGTLMGRRSGGERVPLSAAESSKTGSRLFFDLIDCGGSTVSDDRIL